jgi:Flp pilus assembly protein TadD
MKRVLLFFLIYLFSITSTYANDRDVRLNQLFNELKVNKTNVAANVAQEIWSLWSTHPTDQKLTSILDEGSRLVQDRQLNRAISVFSEAIELDPTWA